MNTNLVQGLGLLVLLAVVRGARIRQTQGGQCGVDPVMDEIYTNCLANTTGFESMRGIVRSFRHDGPGSFTANDVMSVLENFCGDMAEMDTCVVLGISSCEDTAQKLDVVEAFAEKSTICKAKPWIKPLLGLNGDDLMANPQCIMVFMGMIRSCYEGMGGVLDAVDRSTPMSDLIDLLNTVSDTIGDCLVNPNYALLPQGCDSTSAQTFATFVAMIMNILGPPGLALTPEQLQEIQEMA